MGRNGGGVGGEHKGQNVIFNIHVPTLYILQNKIFHCMLHCTCKCMNGCFILSIAMYMYMYM